MLLRRDTREQMILAAEDYARTKMVTIKGEMKDDKWIWLCIVAFGGLLYAMWHFDDTVRIVETVVDWGLRMLAGG